MSYVPLNGQVNEMHVKLNEHFTNIALWEDTIQGHLLKAEISFLFLFYKNIEIPKVVTLNICYFQLNTDNGSNTSLKLTRSSPEVVLLNDPRGQVNEGMYAFD